jgi:hypothetical protein
MSVLNVGNFYFLFPQFIFPFFSGPLLTNSLGLIVDTGETLLLLIGAQVCASVIISYQYRTLI